MLLIDHYYKPETIDCYTFVFDEVTPETGLYTMLAMSADGYTYSQWTLRYLRPKRRKHAPGHTDPPPRPRPRGLGRFLCAVEHARGVGRDTGRG
jgi:hypothetical protein